MAIFLDQIISHDIQGPYVIFTLNVKIKFDKNEIGRKWHLDISLMERDRFSSDDVFHNQYWARPIHANKEIVSIEVNVPISKRDLNTEPGKEEIYAKLKLVSPEEPLVIAKATTNTIKINI